MKTLILSIALMMSGRSVLAMPCDTNWSCKSHSGKYSITVQRCRYVNAIGNLQHVKINGKEVHGSEITAAYDSKSIGGSILAIEVSIPDNSNDAHYISFETVGTKGLVTERIQKFNPGPQKTVFSEALICKEEE
ncbi:MAG: hypothetical protein ACXVCP_04620 [Bdellovibrio sp.]